MDLKSLLEKLDHFAGQAVGQKPGDQVRGTEKAKPSRKIAGTPYSEHPFKGRLVGGGAEQQQESMLKDLSKGKSPKSKEQELAEEYQSFLEAEFRDTVEKRPARKNARPARGHEPLPRYKTVKADEGTMSEKDIELQDYRSMSHKEFQTAYGMTKTEWINKNKALVIQNPDIKKALGLEEGVPYKATNPHPALQDPVVKKVLKQMRPGLTGLEMNNEAFLYFAYELGKTRAREMWEQYGPAIKYGYQSGIGVNEADGNNPVEARWIVKVEDDEGAHLKTFRDEFLNLAAAKKAYEKHKPYASDFKYISVKKETNEAIDSDSVQPIGQDTFNRGGHNPIIDKNDYLKRRSETWNLMTQTTDPQTKAEAKQRILDLDKQARAKKYIQSESRAHNIIATKLKNLERERKFASGELKIPTPQERQAQLKKLEKEPKQVKEYGATSTGSPTSVNTDDVKKAMAATSTLKAATGTSQPAPLLMKAMDTISQGKTASTADMQVAQNTLQDINTAFKEPELANQLKPILAKANQLQQKK